MRGVPRIGFVFAAHYLQPHTESDVMLAAVGRCASSDIGDVFSYARIGISPEQVNVRVLGADVPSLARPSTEVERWMRILVRAGEKERVVQGVEASFEVDPTLRGPERFEDAYLLFHHVVALFLRPANALGLGLGLALTRNEVHTDAARGELVECRNHLRGQEWRDVARPCRDQHTDALRTSGKKSAGDPGFPTCGLHRDEEILEAGLLGGVDHALHHVAGWLDLGGRINETRGVAGGRHEPAEFEGAGWDRAGWRHVSFVP